MEVKTRAKFIRISPRKLNLVADAVRGMKAVFALEALNHLEKRGAEILKRVLKQGIGTAVNNYQLDKESLLIKTILVNKGPTLKRGRPVSRGRWHPILKRTSHLTIVLEGKEKKSDKVTAKPKTVKKKGEKNGTQG